MAQRRMFSLKVIDTDLFLDMPLSTQALYFHLSMRADDDGFIGNHKKIMRMIGSSDDDMKILVAKQLIIPFETGVCVIKHWRVHNYIQKDRYNPTFYKAEKALLVANDNIYEKAERMDTKCIHDVSKTETQVRLGQDRLELGKVRLETELEIEQHIDKKRVIDVVSIFFPQLDKKNTQSIINTFNKINKDIYYLIEKLLIVYDSNNTTNITGYIIKALKEDYPIRFETSLDKLILVWEDELFSKQDDLTIRKRLDYYKYKYRQEKINRGE
ncbi:DNA replication protein [Paraclostridium sordellii]|uniref:DNA replication protein n=1 Tax=Paraclostridium sordellii TaxID=1505 RepID=UPI0005E6D7D5|nr:DNA replication protein [Paeniclostridium sordellii]CEO20640.1 phage replication initiation protein [[Clostridium] sordellii] [Paeniclostridium sordellii]